MEIGEINTFENLFTKKIIKTGRWTLLLAIPLSMMPALYLWARYGAIPPLKDILTAWFMIASIYGVEYVVTPISYYPILGMSGTYMAFLSGNIANVRVPCAIVAQDVIGVKAGTNEGELIATMGMAGSIITNLIMVTLAALAGNYLIGYFPPIILKSFDFVLPAIFGALFSLFAVKFPKFAVFAITVAFILVIVIGSIPTWLIVPMCSFSTIAFAIYSNKEKKAN